MSDLVLDELVYRVDWRNGSFDCSDTAPWRGTLGKFDGNLGDEKLIPTSEFGSVEEGRAAVEPYLESWSMKAELLDNRPIIFVFDSASAHSKSPATTPHLMLTNIVTMSANAFVVVKPARYPDPPEVASATSDLVDDLRFVRETREGGRLLVSSYLFYTRLVFEFGTEADAARHLLVSGNVLEDIAKLSARNDPDHVRKFWSKAPPLADDEREWLREALPKVAFQASVIEAGGAPSILTKSL